MNVRKMVLSSLFAALMAVCAWISLPVGDIAVTMQTFAVFLSLGVLGGKWGCVSIGIYLLLGVVGLPVFSAFQGGVGILLGVTGGYIWGFGLAALVYWAFERLCKPIGVVMGMLCCYACGSLWFLTYVDGAASLAVVIAKCVAPYLIPDAVKLWLAWRLAQRIGKRVN